MSVFSSLIIPLCEKQVHLYLAPPGVTPSQGYKPFLCNPPCSIATSRQTYILQDLLRLPCSLTESNATTINCAAFEQTSHRVSGQLSASQRKAVSVSGNTLFPCLSLSEGLLGMWGGGGAEVRGTLGEGRCPCCLSQWEWRPPLWLFLHWLFITHTDLHES